MDRTFTKEQPQMANRHEKALNQPVPARREGKGTLYTAGGYLDRNRATLQASKFLKETAKLKSNPDG